MKWKALVASLALGAGLMAATEASAQYARANYSEPDSYESHKTFSPSEIVDKGNSFFGSMSRGLGGIVEKATSQWGEPDAYILGEEGAGSFVGGLRYGEGKLFTREGEHGRVYWQGPSIGFDFGGDGARTMILVYNLRSRENLFTRFAGINGSAYFVGGLGMTALKDYNTVLVPIRTGVGFRLGVNVGYLKFTQSATWNPF